MDYESVGRRFDSCRGRHRVTTRLQHCPIGPHTDRTGNGGVGPALGIVLLPQLLPGKGCFAAVQRRGIFRGVSLVGRKHLIVDQKIAGSTPARLANFYSG